jgi:predicted RNA-binding protein with PIN domain
VWKQALDLNEHLYRAAQRLETEAHPRLAERLIAAAAELAPAAAASAERLHEQLVRIEGLVVLSARVGGIPTAEARKLIGLLGAVRTPGASPQAPGPSAPPPAPAPARKPETVRRPSVPQPTPPDRLVVDGCNFLGRAPGYELGDNDSRDRLLLRLQEYARIHPAHRVSVFFDGQRASRRVTSGVEEHVTSSTRSADDLIVEFVRSLPAGERPRTILVTDDRQLATRAKGAGVRAESVSWLLGRFTEPATQAAARPGARSGMSAGEISEWEEFFNKPPQRPGRK